MRSGATSSDGVLVVRCRATSSVGAVVVLAWAKTLRESSKDDDGSISVDTVPEKNLSTPLKKLISQSLFGLNQVLFRM